MCNFRIVSQRELISMYEGSDEPVPPCIVFKPHFVFEDEVYYVLGKERWPLSEPKEKESIPLPSEYKEKKKVVMVPTGYYTVGDAKEEVTALMARMYDVKVVAEESMKSIIGSWCIALSDIRDALAKAQESMSGDQGD